MKKKKKKNLSPFVWILILLLVGFLFSQYLYYQKEWQFKAIIPGESTRSKIESIFGAPIPTFNQDEGTVCDEFKIENILGALYHGYNYNTGALECSEIYPESEILKRCVYWGNSLSFLRFRFQESIELFYNEDTTVSSTDCAYDRIIMNEDAFGEYYGIDTGITEDQSDYYLVWVELET